MADHDQTPDGDDGPESLASASSDLTAALGDLLASGLGDDEESEPDDAGEDFSGGLDLAALEDAVAELGLDVEAGDDAPVTEFAPDTLADTPADAPADDDGPVTFELEASPDTRSLGLDLTELPPPAAPAVTPVEREMPPLGQATADDLFGPLDDTTPPGLPSTWDEPAVATTSSDDDDVVVDGFADEPSPLAELADLPAPEMPFDPAAEASAPEAADPEPEAEPAAPDAAMADVVGFTAHGGTITGDIRAKARKLFGR